MPGTWVFLPDANAWCLLSRQGLNRVTSGAGDLVSAGSGHGECGDSPGRVSVRLDATTSTDFGKCARKELVAAAQAIGAPTMEVGCMAIMAVTKTPSAAARRKARAKRHLQCLRHLHWLPPAPGEPQLQRIMRTAPPDLLSLSVKRGLGQQRLQSPNRQVHARRLQSGPRLAA